MKDAVLAPQSKPGSRVEPAVPEGDSYHFVYDWSTGKYAWTYQRRNGNEYRLFRGSSDVKPEGAELRKIQARFDA